jgi:hypothetical protein
MNELKKKFEEEQRLHQEERKDLRIQIEKLLEKYNSSTTNINIDTQNNIHIHINAFGKENLDYITNEFLVKCVGKIYDSVPMLIEKIHFDPAHPENHNVKITNKKLPHASVMTEDKKWRLMNKEEVISNMVVNGYNMIDEKFSENPGVYSEERRRHYRKFQSNYDNEEKETMKRVKSDVEYVILNGTKELHLD